MANKYEKTVDECIRVSIKTWCVCVCGVLNPGMTMTMYMFAHRHWGRNFCVKRDGDDDWDVYIVDVVCVCVCFANK